MLVQHLKQLKKILNLKNNFYSFVSKNYQLWFLKVRRGGLDFQFVEFECYSFYVRSFNVLCKCLDHDCDFLSSDSGHLVWLFLSFLWLIICVWSLICIQESSYTSTRSRRRRGYEEEVKWCCIHGNVLQNRIHYIVELAWLIS